jgi:hypothetical protein
MVQFFSPLVFSEEFLTLFSFSFSHVFFSCVPGFLTKGAGFRLRTEEKRETGGLK